jgi:hypothetical protein
VRVVRTWGGVNRIDATLYRNPFTGNPLPGGFAVAVRTLVYTFAAFAVVALLGQVPVVADVLGVLKPVPRYAVAVGAGVLASGTRVNGRRIHVLAVDAAAYYARSRLTSAGRTVRETR